VNDTDTESGLVFLKLTIPEPRLGLEPLKVRDFNETRPRREVSEYPVLHGKTFRYPLTRFDLRPYLDLDLGGHKFRIAITPSILKL